MPARLKDNLQRIWSETKQLRYDKKLRRYILFALAADVVGYSLVYVLTSQDVMGAWWANTTVSKSMAPIGLALNTLALTGKVRPTICQAAKWIACWMPTATAGVFVLGLVVTFGFESLETRALAGAMVFPVDYVLKRFIIFAKQVRLANFLFRQRFALTFAGFLLWKLATSHQTFGLRLAETA